MTCSYAPSNQVTKFAILILTALRIAEIIADRWLQTIIVLNCNDTIKG